MADKEVTNQRKNTYSHNRIDRAGVHNVFHEGVDYLICPKKESGLSTAELLIAYDSKPVLLLDNK